MRIVYIGVLGILLLAVIGCGGGSTPFVPPIIYPIGATGTVQGYVYAGATGLQVEADVRAGATALAGVTVSVGGYPTLANVTDDKGHFQLADVPCGARRLYLSRIGFTRTAVTLTVNEGDNTINPSDPQTPAPYKWTVLVYMAADNSLDGAGLDDINEMEQVGSTQEMKVLVQYDRAATGAWTDTRRFEVGKDNDPVAIHPVNMQSLGEVNTGNPASLTDFITWGQQTAPAEHYLLVLWNHGSGWDTSGDQPSLRSIAIDNTNNNDAIRIAELSTALIAKQPIDIVACDACLMAMLEVAYEIRNTADYLIASEELSPDVGYRYERMLGTLTSAEGLAMTPAQYAAFMTNDTAVQWANYGYSTCATIDLGKMDILASELNTLAQRLRAVGANYPSAIQNAREQGELFDSSSVEVRADLGYYATLLASAIPDQETKTAAQRLSAAVNNAVIANIHTPFHPHATGISIYLPSPVEYARDGSAYPLLALAKNTAWEEWLATQPQ